MYSGCACRKNGREEGAKDLSSFFSSVSQAISQIPESVSKPLSEIPKAAFEKLPQEGQTVLKQLAGQISSWGSSAPSAGALSHSFYMETHDKSCVQKIYKERDELRKCAVASK